ncbi:MAG: lysophospholipid acyltransferase family protein [Sedimenticola sp.]|nr:lysophospholipid acyltransferase family protein [Sedimenticola sp.]MCW8948309.1 lysophospholipid acyltransferase family protein [Sedimenticola sp.]MCW8949520.1 lysophospholipid acyltransferase family protein [Sedimenticola sp.]MCW8975357.1 lysophospholipid acyltransferase family protein [Sedimenticola sp.]MCW9021784.1 lysophospholipid acyltransferase family protein [Sedimenticola sp.]
MQDKVILFILALFSRLPLSFAQRVGKVLGWLAYKIPNKERRIAKINIATCLPELSELQRDILLKDSMIESAKGVVEMPIVWASQPARWIDLVIPGEGAGLFEKTISKGKGVIAVGPHLGNWEVGLHYLTSLAKVTAIYRPPRREVLDDLLKQGRGQGGATLVPATPQGVKTLYGALKRGEMMALLADQQPKAAGRQGGNYAPFFGHPALTMVLIGRLARKTGAPVLFWFMERLPGARGYKMHWFRAPEGIDSDDPDITAAALNQGLEQCIRHAPAQYLWSYKRFASQPDGVISPYSTIVS